MIRTALHKPPPDDDDGIQTHHLKIEGSLAQDVRALVAVRLEKPSPLPLAVAPHDCLMLTVDFHGAADAKARLGENTCLTGIREWTGAFTGGGPCVAMFALLTPLGAVRLLEARPLQQAQRIRARVAELLDERLTRELESRIACAGDVEAKLRVFAQWLEARAVARRMQDRAALRAGRAALRLTHEPSMAVERAADEQHVSRRQLERDFERWVGVSPRHLSQVARVQQVSRAARSGHSLADAAAAVGFADQAHMSRVVRQLTGLTPRQFVASERTPISRAFRAATGGGTVYL